MLSLGPLAFAAPWILLALAALPVLIWLLRVVPPAPKRLSFPAIRLLYDLKPRDETSATTPWWLLLLRLLLAALVILALAQPLLNPRAQLVGGGPMLLLIDDGWAAGRNWQARQQAADELLDQAERSGREVILLTTAPNREGVPGTLNRLRPGEARSQVQALLPKPWPGDRQALLTWLESQPLPNSAESFWLSDGVDSPGATALASRLQRLGALTVMEPEAGNLPRLAFPPESGVDGLTATVARAPGIGPSSLWLRALAADGRILAREQIEFPTGETSASKRIVLPTELRNEIARLDIENDGTAGSVALIDERWRRRPVGLVSETSFQASQPLLSELHYLDQALSPFSEVRRGRIETLLERELAVILLPDSGTLAGPEREALQRWVREGGLLLRFAGPILASTVEEGGEQALVPVRLRQGGRLLGGALSWTQPAQLAPFPSSGPFRGLTIPPDVTVQRQVLAQPSLDLNDRTWAALQDGTPLVTAAQEGDGWLVLVHTTANPDWTNLPISGLFVQMLQRVVAMSQGVQGARGDQPLPPVETLDGFGRLVTPPAAVQALLPGNEEPRFGPTLPPGFYGSDQARIALNLAPAIGSVTPLGELPGGIARLGYERGEEVDLRPFLFTAALILLLLDMLISLLLRGLLPPGRMGSRAGGTAAILAVVALAMASPAHAQTQSDDSFALAASLTTVLAYVRTGDRDIDETSRDGLIGLSRALQRRTAVEPGEPMGINVETDDLAFFSLLYWPVAPSQSALSQTAISRLNSFLRTGGTIVFDTRDQGEVSFGGTSPGLQRLQQMTRGLDIPQLEPIPDEHVLTKTFYLMDSFPGRFTGGTIWVERPGGRSTDEVSSVIVGSHDWAAAWAVDGNSRHRFPVMPGGEVQREWAYRFGVNLVMYALTGNYKADQVHIPSILERLGQ
ncbi:MAG: DUF4159 domain-containing protein [Alphaproteobacteria bacterium]|nr:DUF4159 domain-containing protein [Alphaproteobacteria bacterium]MBU0795749.1 DUF4159 domain-containing protein [Alphaproteobacteria bacterium]MBU0887372.1 DUF4159 domain-containing protein [Alphaproteobacteria bacterium]MBU1811747.1 DUF4159 domain-containing protein [Alphaproteobacteria bacterium]